MDIAKGKSYAYIKLPNGKVVEGEVASYSRYYVNCYSEIVEITMKNGTKYVTHWSNVVIKTTYQNMTI